MYDWFLRAFLESQEGFEHSFFDGDYAAPPGMSPHIPEVPLDFPVTEALVGVGTSMYEDNQTAFAMRSLGVAAVLASADGPLPFGDALAVTVLVGAGVYGLGDSFGWW